MTKRERFLKYALHIGLSITIPVLFVILSIVITGNREKGIIIGIVTAFLILNVFYSFYFLKSTFVINTICGLFVTGISIGITYAIFLFKIKLSFDFYGIWTGLICYGISSILAWELLYQILKNRIKTS